MGQDLKALKKIEQASNKRKDDIQIFQEGSIDTIGSWSRISNIKGYESSANQHYMYPLHQ